MITKKYAIIVAGGSGLRMGAEIPKQFIVIGGKPVLMHTLSLFHLFDPNINLILVLPSTQFDYWQQLCAKHHFVLPHQITSGGNTRFESVKNGLALVDDASLIAIHDGVRPFVSQATLQRCFDTAQKLGNAIPVLDAFESVRMLDADGTSKAIDRSQIKLIQTPQVFQARQLLQAYDLPFQPLFTDDASVVEAAGYPITLVEGNRENIKITTPHDLILAEVFLKR